MNYVYNCLTSTLNSIFVNVVFTEQVNASDPHERGTVDMRRRVAKFHVLAIFDVDCAIYHKWPWLSYY